MISSLKEFLVYLEDKKIINPSSLENQSEVQNLIQDLLKLDLNKFKVPKQDQKPAAPASTAFKKRGGSQSIPDEDI